MIEKTCHGGNLWKAAEKYGMAPQDFIDFSANINPLGPSPCALQVLQDNLGMIKHYPEPYGERLKTVLGKYLGIDSLQIILGNGASELIYLCSRMFYQNRILVLAPSFSEYGQGIADPKMVRVNLEAGQKYQLPLAEILSKMQENDLIFIANPNNPTGNLFGRDELLELVEEAERKHCQVIIDEAFMDFVNGDGNSLRDQVSKHGNLLVLGSLTKFLALPGLRIGYAIAAPDTISRMDNLLPPWRINTLALLAGEASLRDQEYMEKTRLTINEQRERLKVGLEQLAGLQVYPSSTNFMLVNAQGCGITADELQNRLGPRGILIRNCNDFHNLSAYHFRLAVRIAWENDTLLKILREVL